MNKPKDEFIELADTIHDTPVFPYDNTTPTYVNSKINGNQSKFAENIYSNNNIERDIKILKDGKMDKKLDNKIILQRENRRIISMIKKIINKNEPQNTTKLYIKNLLINYKRDITLLKDDKRNTLLHIFTELKDVSSLQIILEIYIEFLNISKQFYEFLFLKNMDSQNIFDISVQIGDIPIIKLLYEQIEKDNNYYEKILKMKYIQNNLFHIASKNNQIFPILFFYEKLKSFFNHNNNDILNSNESNEDKIAPIHYACKNRNIKLMNLLLDLGANINIQDKKGYTPLHYAVLNNDERMIKHLLIRGADKKVKDENNLTPYNLSFILGDKNLAKILYHKNCCQSYFCREEIGPISKRNNMKILFIGLIFSIIIKISIIIRFYFVLNDIFIDFSILASFNNDNYIFNRLNNEENSKELHLNDFFYCFDDNCKIEVGILFFSLFIDFLLLLNVIIFKCCSKNIFIPKQNKSLSILFEENENLNICVKCKININENTQHCLVCDRCVENWDHHCFWLNTCINNINYSEFKFFIFSVILFLIFNLIFFVASIYLLLSSKELFMKKIFNVSDGSIWKKILTVAFVCIDIYLIIFISYSLIFVLIPIIKYLYKKYSKNKIKKSKKEKGKEVDYKTINSIIDKEEEDDEDIIKVETNNKGI